MLINGNEASTDIDKILSKLESLPSSFPNYQNIPYVSPLSVEAQQSYTEAVQKYNEGYQDFTIGKTEEVIRKLENIEQKSSVDKGLLLNVNILMANSYQKLGQLYKAAVQFQKSAQYSLESKQYYGAENLYKTVAVLHRQNNTIDQYQKTLETNLQNSQNNNDHQLELDTRLALGGVHRVQNNHDAAIEQYSVAYSLQQGKVDTEAYRIEQHEVGFSNQEKIGTDNIQQCVAVVIYDPESKKTALAHVDRFTDPTSLSKDVIDRFPNDKKLEVYLVGGRDRNPQSIGVSDANIKKVTEILKQYSNIDIKAADIGNKEIPSGIVFDPTTGKLEHAVPGKEDKSSVLRQAKLCLMNTQDNNSKLDYAFDLAESKNIPIPNFSEVQQVKFVKQWYNQGVSAIPTLESWQANQVVNPLNKAVEEIRKNNQQLVNHVINGCTENKIDNLRNLNNNQKQKLKVKILNSTTQSMNDGKPLSKIRENILNSINTSIKITYIDTIKGFFKDIKNMLIEFKDKVNDFVSSTKFVILENINKIKSKDVKGQSYEQKVEPAQNVNQQEINNKYQTIKAQHEKNSPIQINSKIIASNTISNKKINNAQVTRF